MYYSLVVSFLHHEVKKRWKNIEIERENKGRKEGRTQAKQTIDGWKQTTKIMRQCEGQLDNEFKFQMLNKKIHRKTGKERKKVSGCLCLHHGASRRVPRTHLTTHIFMSPSQVELRGILSLFLSLPFKDLTLKCQSKGESKSESASIK